MAWPLLSFWLEWYWDWSCWRTTWARLSSSRDLPRLCFLRREAKIYSFFLPCPVGERHGHGYHHRGICHGYVFYGGSQYCTVSAGHGLWGVSLCKGGI